MKPNFQARKETGKYSLSLLSWSRAGLAIVRISAQSPLGRCRRNREISSTRFSPIIVWRMSRLTRDGTAEPVSQDQILRRERRQENNHFPSSADHEQDWQPYPVDLYSSIICVIMTIRTYIHIPPGFRGGVHLFIQTAIRQWISPSLSGHATAYRRRLLPRVRRQHKASSP